MQNDDIRIAVVGGGIYGCMVATSLSAICPNIFLFERNSELLSETSMTNQYRVHKGYHYPRSDKTIAECLLSAYEFEASYPEAIIKEFTNFYAIASNYSRTTSLQYLDVLKKHKLPFQLRDDAGIDLRNIELLVSTPENLYDPFKLRNSLLKDLRSHSVQIKCDSPFSEEMANDYDFIVFCCYSANELFSVNHNYDRSYKFQIVEKLIIEPPPKLKSKSLVIMDGPFCCIDPLGRSGNSVVGHVEHAVHETYISPSLLPKHNILNLSESLKKRYQSKKDEILVACSKYMPDILDSTYLDSMWSIRKVQTDTVTDARTSDVRFNGKYISVFSGKVSSSLKCAREVCNYISNAI